MKRDLDDRLGGLFYMGLKWDVVVGVEEEIDFQGIVDMFCWDKLGNDCVFKK